MNGSMFIEIDINDGKLSSALEKVVEVLNNLDKRLIKIEETVFGKIPSKIETDINDLDGSVASVQKRLENLEINQRRILGDIK